MHLHAPRASSSVHCSKFVLVCDDDDELTGCHRCPLLRRHQHSYDVYM